MTHGQRRDKGNKHRGIPSRRLVCNMKTRDVGGPDNIALPCHQAPTLPAQKGYPNVPGIGGRLVSIIKENVAALSLVSTIPLGGDIINNQKLPKVLTRTMPSMCPDTTTALLPPESLQLWLTSIALHFDVARIAVVVASQRPRCRSHTWLLSITLCRPLRLHALREVLRGNVATGRRVTYVK